MLFAALGSACVGTVPFFATRLQKSGVDTASLLALRYWIALLILLPLAALTVKAPAEEWRRHGRWLFLNSLTLGALNTYFYYTALETVATSIAATLFFTYPVVVLLIDRFLFRLDIRAATVVATLAVLSGAVLVSAPQLANAHAQGIGLAMAAAVPVIYAVSSAISYRYIRGASTFLAASSIYGGLASVFTIMVAFRGLTLPSGLDGWVAMLAIATVGGVLQIASFAYALPRLSASGYAILVGLERVTVVIIGVTLLGERLSAVQIAGALLVLAGVTADRIVRSRPR